MLFIPNTALLYPGLSLALLVLSITQVQLAVSNRTHGLYAPFKRSGHSGTWAASLSDIYQLNVDLSLTT